MTIASVKNKVRLVDVAESCGVSKTAVSAILNNRKHSVRVSPETRKRVILAAEELGYIPESSSLSLSRNRYSVVDVFCSMRAIAGARFLHALHKKGHELGVRIGLHNMEIELATSRNPLPPKILNERGMDGIVINCEVGQLIEAQIERLNVPVVWANHNRFEDVNCIRYDETQSVNDLADGIVDMGHVRVGYLSPSWCGHYSENIRYEGLRNRFEDRGIELPDSCVEFVNFAYCHAAVDRLVLGNKVSCLVCYTASQAGYVMRRLRQLGLRVPEDISIVGFDIPPETKHEPVSITGTILPQERLGCESLEMLSECIENGKNVPSRVLVAEYCRNESLGPVKEGKA